MSFKDKLVDALIMSIRRLPSEVEAKIISALDTESNESGLLALSAIKENIKIARESNLPLCQDTGMFWCLAEIGRDSNANISELEELVSSSCREAADLGYFRKSVVTDAMGKRVNTKTNLPVVMNYTLVDGKDIYLNFLFKGFGSENCSGVMMLNPTAGEEGVVKAAVSMMERAGGKPCPPVFLGIGVGGTMDRAALLSKRAFFKEGEESSLERRIRESINSLKIGPGGLGGDVTCLSVQLLEEETHIAGLPVAMTVNCWCDRKLRIRVER